MTNGWKTFKQDGQLQPDEDLRKLGLLIVDDESDIVASLGEMFQQSFDIYLARSGPEALARFKEHGPKLVITDQRMPDMNGLQLLQQLRDIDPTLVAILVTGYSDIHVVVQALNEGLVYKYIAKPWDPAELRRLVVDAGQKYLRHQGLDLQRYRLVGLMGC